MIVANNWVRPTPCFGEARRNMEINVNPWSTDRPYAGSRECVTDRAQLSHGSGASGAKEVLPAKSGRHQGQNEGKENKTSRQRFSCQPRPVKTEEQKHRCDYMRVWLCVALQWPIYWYICDFRCNVTFLMCFCVYNLKLDTISSKLCHYAPSRCSKPIWLVYFCEKHIVMLWTDSLSLHSLSLHVFPLTLTSYFVFHRRSYRFGRKWRDCKSKHCLIFPSFHSYSEAIRAEERTGE